MPVDVDEFLVEEILRAKTTWLARRATGERVVLKKLPADCLRHGKLHPSISLRLTRLRELPHTAFVNLLGVHRVNDDIVLVTEYARGESFSEVSHARRRPLLLKVQQVVQELHRLGFVHGNIHGGNVIVHEDESVSLIDPSPLLHDDPAVDLAALRAMGVDAGPPLEPVLDLEVQKQSRQAWAGALACSVVGIAITVVAVYLVRYS